MERLATRVAEFSSKADFWNNGVLIFLVMTALAAAGSLSASAWHLCAQAKWHQRKAIWMQPRSMKPEIERDSVSVPNLLQRKQRLRKGRMLE